jgi:predicted glycosyltransferase
VWALALAADHAERVISVVFLGAGLPIPDIEPLHEVFPFDDMLDTEEGWAKRNRHYMLKDWKGYVEFHMTQCLPEPHSTRAIEFAVEMGLETTPEAYVALAAGEEQITPANVEDYMRRVRCPVLVITGDQDIITAPAIGIALAEKTHGRLVTIAGGGHNPAARDPVYVNQLLYDFIRPTPPQTLTWTRARSRQRRALYVSSPIGLGHAQRDLAIADELRKLRPDVQVDWLAQHPVTAVLEARGERIHPASRYLASESKHIESESAEHDLQCFQAFRRMDEILIANYMVFHDVAQETPYDLWIGDEAWDLDHFLYEVPEEKRAAYAWLTDFVGFLPMPDGGDHEAFLTADYNAEMLEQIERYPRIRDRAIFVGNPDDIVPAAFGRDLPAIREWTEQHYEFSGYITGFNPADFADREAIRAQLGYHPDEQVCLVAVGGSGVGYHLLRRVMAAYPTAKRQLPALRMIVVAGPRIEPASLPHIEGVEVRAYVHELYRHLAMCDLAVVQGGLSTSMELTANKRPFLYFPLQHHFEQNFHVPHRLDRYGAGRCMDYATATPESIAAAMVAEMGRDVCYRDVETDGAARAAALIAPLI